VAGTRHFVYRLIPHQPTGGNPRVDAVIGEHLSYWAALFDAGRVVVAGPVATQLGVWGLAVVAADSLEQVQLLGHADPAVAAGIADFEVLEMPSSLARPLRPTVSSRAPQRHPAHPRRTRDLPRPPGRCT
jgi:uncharacterized protein YciI